MIEAINEQLLRAIGVGVALVDMKTGALRFANDTFVGWFGEPGEGPVPLGGLDLRAAFQRVTQALLAQARTLARKKTNL